MPNNSYGAKNVEKIINTKATTIKLCFLCSNESSNKIK